MSTDKKICPYCGEEIMADAKKCRHCGEWLEVNRTHNRVKRPLLALLVVVILAAIGVAIYFHYNGAEKTTSCEKPQKTAHEILHSEAYTYIQKRINDAAAAYKAEVSKGQQGDMELAKTLRDRDTALRRTLEDFKKFMLIDTMAVKPISADIFEIDTIFQSYCFINHYIKLWEISGVDVNELDENRVRTILEEYNRLVAERERCENLLNSKVRTLQGTGK